MAKPLNEGNDAIIRLAWIARQTSYPIEAIIFVLHAIGPPDDSPPADSVDIPALCRRIRDHYMIAYGQHAYERLDTWSIRSWRDFGRIVVALARFELLPKCYDRPLEEFEAVFDIRAGFQVESSPEQRAAADIRRRRRHQRQWKLSTLFLITTIAALVFAGFSKLGLEGAIGMLFASWLGVIGSSSFAYAVFDRRKGWRTALVIGLFFIVVALVMFFSVVLYEM